MKTKSLLQTFLTLLALMTCLFMRPDIAKAQTSVPYYTSVGGEYLPTGWIADHYGVTYQGTYYYAFNTGHIILPEFNVPTNTLTVDVRVEPFYDPPFGSSFEIGYLTDVNNLSTFHSVELFTYIDEPWDDGWKWKRAVLTDVPANARIAFYAFYRWSISDVRVYETPDPIDVPYTLTFNSQNLQPEGWYANNYDVYSNERFFQTGTAVLPQFTSNLSTLQLDLSFKPRNSTAQSIEIGFVNSNDNFTPLNTYTYSSAWTGFEPKRVKYYGSLSGCRMAIRCTGEWCFQGVRVTTKNTPLYNIPYQPSFDMFQPEGWVAENYMYSEEAYFLSGVAYLPQFSSNLNTLQLNLDLKPKDATAQSIEFGYINSNNSFVPLKVYDNSSSWTSYDTKTVVYSNAPSDGRMAFRCYGKWCIDNMIVQSLPSPTIVPYTANLYSHTPAGWIAENYHHYGNTNVPYSWLSTGCAILPQFNYSINSLQLDICIGPLNSDAQNISLGYVTNPNDPSTFTAIRTYYYENTFTPKRIYFTGSIPTGARMAILCNGEWKIDHVHVEVPPTSLSVPYDATINNNMLPLGWIADNYYSFYTNHARLSSGCTILPQFNVALNTLQMDICLSSNSGAQNILIGYVTNSNPSTFTAIKTYTPSWEGYQPKRISFNVSGVPSNARMALYCNGDWVIGNIHVEVPTTTYAVPYTATLGSTSQPEGWAADNYNYHSTSGAYLSTGCAILPQFSTSIGSLEMDLALRPKGSSAQSILIGYVINNNPSTFTALQAYSALSSWSDYLPKRIIYSGVPSGAQMAIYCNGDWGLGGVEVMTIQSTSTSFDVPYHATFTPTALPEGWIVSNYYYSGNAYLTTGCAILPQFNASLNTLLLDIMVKPKNTNAQSIQVGYVTNNSASTFVPLQTFSNSSLWGLYQPKRVLYNVNGLPSGARMAIRCNGDWYINDASVYSIPQPFAVPYSLPSTMGYEQPEGWIANNYGYNSTPRFTNGCALLPKFNVPVNALNMHLSFRYENGDSPSLSVGYVTNDNPSTFTPLWTHTQTTGGWRYFDVFLGGAPANSRIAIRCEGSWTIDIVDITMPTLSVPYTQDFQDIAIGSLPQGWTAANMSVQNGNTSYKRLQGTDFAVLSYFDNAELNTLQLDFRCRPSIMNYGGMISVGYIPSGGNLNNFVGLHTLYFQTYWTEYRDMHIAFSNVPAGARLAFQCIAYGNGNEWMIDDVHIYPAKTLPFTEPFATSSLPEGWSTYLGDLNWDPVATTYTDIMMTPSTSVWNFGTKNGVFDSHAYTVLGANSNEHKWLVSPPVILGNADNVYLTFDLGLTRQSGNQVPVTPGAQDEELILVMISNDGGYTWHFARGWSSEMDGLGDLNYLHPDGDSYYHSLNTYRNQTVQVAFYVECTNGSNATNNVHIDNVSIQSFNLSTPPVTMTVSEIGGYSAKVQWTAAYPMQNDWDVCVCAADLTTPPTNLIVHRHGYKWYRAENLEEGTQYKAWVRYNSGNGITSNWICSDVFETLLVNHPIPFAEPFATSSAPYGWSTYYGDLHWDPTIFTYTNVEMMSSNNAWEFGQQNGVFDSHAYTLLGANSHEHKWLVSPPVILGNADNICLTFDLGMTRQSGNQVPITYGEQVEQRIFVMISNDGGNTWHIVRGWCGEITSWGGDINNLDPEGDNYYCSLNAYRNQIIQVAFYAECSDGSTPENNVHIDNVSIQSYDFTAPPISVTASDIGGYSAKVSWTSTYPMQINWDVCVCEAWATTPTGPIVQLRDYGLRYYQVQGLEEATQYKAWVRYNDGTTTGNWRCSDVFETLMITHPIPFDEPFATSSAPYGWATYVGALNESNGVYTATLTPNTDYSWTFGQQNGVFDSHAYAMMGNTSGNERRWLVSPPINLGGANDVFFSFDLALSNATGNQVPVTSGEQDHQRVAVLVTDDDGATWNVLAGWSGVMTGWSDLNALTPQGETYYYSLSAYQNETVKVAFYAECTNSGDATNHVHIDNVGIQSHDLSAAPSTVSVSEVDLHSAKVSWTAAAPEQASQPHWDVCVCDYWYETPPTELIVHRDGYMWYNYTGLTEGTEYRAWVRYHDGNTISDWTSSGIFVTEMDCAAPTNVQVTTTMYDINISWEPGQSNQTSWMVTIWGGEEWESNVIETTSYVFDATNLLMPGETFLVSVMGYCEDGDGWASTDWVHAQMQDYPTLTVNEGQDWSSEVVIQMDRLGYTESWSQFIIPSEMLTDLQFSTISQLRFVCDKGYTEWNNEVFSVYLQEVDFDDLESFCGDAFYMGEMSLFYQGTLSVGTNHIMAIDASWDGNLFHYRDRNLLVSIQQDTDDQNTQDPQFVWAGTDISDPLALAPEQHDMPYCVTFLPNTSFRYETDTYLPPTDFQAYVMSGYEVSFMWTPREDQIATEIMICASPDFIGNSVVINSTENNYTADMPDFFEPETTYYYCYRGTYEANGEIHYSSWSTMRSFVMPNTCQPPINLQVSDVGPFSAHVSWTSDGESDELAYRITSDNSSLNVVMQEGFDGCTAPALPSDWSTIKNGTGGSGWTVYSYGGHDQHYPCARSIARQSDQTDDWLITPQMELMGEFEFWAHSEILYLDVLPTINVYVSTTGTDMDDFELVYTYTLPDYTWRKITIDLSSYSGNGYIAIRHQCNPTNVTYLFLDDFSHSTPSWNSLGNIEGDQYDFNGLNCGVTYQVKVKANCSTGYYSHWTEPVTFSTPGNIVFADDNVKAICVDEFDLNGDNEISYDEAAVVTGLGEIFRGNASITSFNELQYFTGLTTIGANAFESCASLSAITLPPTITSIGYNAFGSNTQDVGCTSLHSIIIPPSVTTIGDWAFQHSGLTEINLPYSVTNIGVLAFGYCNSLTSITLPATVTHIEGNAFTGASIASIEVAEGNPVYDSRNGCNAIIHTPSNTLITGCKNTVVPYGVTAIGVSAFESSANLTSITLPETVQSIGGWAFLWTGLTDITLPGVGETIGEYAFRNCSNLYTIEIAGTVPPDIPQPNAFDGCPNMSQIHVYVPCGSMDIYTATDWNDFDLAENCNIVFEDNLTKELCVNAWDRNFDGELSYREAAAVQSIGTVFQYSNITRFNELRYFTGLDMINEDDFTDCVNLTAVTFPPTVTYIDADAFLNCTSLTSITFGENIRTIYNYAFSGCTGLNFIIVKATTPPTLGEYAFYDAEIDIPVYVPCGTKATYLAHPVWGNVFEDYNIVDMCDYINFEDLAVKAICVDEFDLNGDEEISYYEASRVTSLGEIFRDNLDIHTFNELWYFSGLTEISDNAFKGCAWLNQVELPATIASIGNLAFYNTGLTYLNIPVGTQTIGFSAFGQCRNLTTVGIPASVSYIEGNPFGNCPALNSISVDPNNPVYDSHSNCKAIIETATNTLVTGGKGSVIPDDVTALGSYAFSGQTTIASITLPTSIASLGNGVFENCTGLTVVNVQAETPPTLGYNVFDGVPDDVVISIPCGTKAAYTQSWAPYAANLYDGCAYIEFVDANVEAICASNWGSDGHITYDQAAAVTTLNPSGTSNSSEFAYNHDITSFDELQYFTGLTSIEAYAFSGCTSLTSITLPNTTTSLATMAFSHCTSLTAITIPNTVTTIANQAFDHCSSLTSVYIPASVTQLGSYNPSNPFYGCSALESITVDEGNTVYTDGNCNAIINMNNHYLVSGCKNTVIPDDVVQICAGAFDECAGLTSVVIPNSVTYINLSAFDGCTDLTAVTIGSGVQTISSRAFRNCTNLASITVLATTPPSWSGSNNTLMPFYNVPTDIPVYVPCQSIEDYQAATAWSNFTNIQARTDVICFEDDAVKAICVDHWDSDGDREVSYAEVAYVHTLSNYFSSNTTITSFNELQYFVRLSDLTAYAFNGCSALESVTLPEGVVSISSYAFNGCTSLESITIPETTTQIWERAFFGCTSLESITIPNAVTTIGDHAFYGCTSLTDITIGERVSSMDQYVFGACANLQSITVMADIPPTLEYGVFYQVPTNIPVYVPCGSEAAYQVADGWSEFTNYVPMPMDGIICFADPAVKAVCVAPETGWDTNGDGKLSYVEAYMVDYQTFGTVFQYNTDITTFDELQYFTGLTRIPNHAFDGCSNLTSVVLPAGLDWIGYNAFENCTSLAGPLVFPESVTHIGWEAFRNCESLTGELVLPPNLNFLGHSSFYHCTGLSGTLEFPTTLTEIQLHAFNGCSGITNLVLHEGINDIQGNAFASCTGLTSITVLATTPPGSTVASAPFYGDDFDIPVYIPCGTKAAYQAHESWHNFTNFQYINCPELASVFYFVEGWNWWAPVVEVTLEGADGLAATLEGDATLINSQNGGFLRYEVVNGQGNWSGTLSHTFRPGQMYKIYLESEGEYEVTGIEVPEVTLTIVQGYNWFGYVGANAAVGAVFGSDFQPAVNDKIVDEAGHTATYNGTEWEGNLTNLSYGTAYIYYSNSSTPKTVVMTE